MRKHIFNLITQVTLVILCASCGGGGGSGGTAADNGGSGAVGGSPTIPAGLQASGVIATQLTLSWDASSDDSMVMVYQVSGGVPAAVMTGSTSYDFTGLDPDTQYCFSVEAIDDEGNYSGTSTALCVRTQPEPDAPWVTVREGVGDPLTQVVWTGAKLLTVADPDTIYTKILTSTDGLTWDILPSASGAYGLDELVYTGGGYVGMTFNFSSASVYTSPDGVAWSRQTGVNPGPALDFTYSPELGLYVVVGEEGYIATSPDALSWTVVNDPAGFSPVTTVNLLGVRSLGGTLFAVGNGETILSSTDGSNWTVLRSDETKTYQELFDVAWNGQTGAGALYVATGYYASYTSADGVSWEAQGPTGWSEQVVWGGGSANCFVTVGTSNHLYTSPDGATWTERFVNEDTIYAQGDLHDVVWTGNLFVVTGDKGTILTSPDGVDWTIRASGQDLNGVRYLNNQFVAVGDNGRIALSSDAMAWDYLYTGDDNHYLYDVASNGSGTWILPGQTYMLRSQDDMLNWEGDWWGATSVDNATLWDGARFLWVGDGSILGWDGASFDSYGDIDWQWSHFGGSDYYKDLDWDGSVYVAVGYSGVILTSDTATLAAVSADATSWTYRTDATVTTANLYAVTKGPGRHVAVGASGTIITSDDGGVTWTAKNSGFANTLYDVAWTGTDYVAVGYSGTILTSSDGVTWSSYDHGVGNLNSVVAGGGEVLIVGDNGLIVRRQTL